MIEYWPVAAGAVVGWAIPRLYRAWRRYRHRHPKCPRCGGRDTVRVTGTWPGGVVYRHKYCWSCESRFGDERFGQTVEGYGPR